MAINPIRIGNFAGTELFAIPADQTPAVVEFYRAKDWVGATTIRTYQDSEHYVLHTVMHSSVVSGVMTIRQGDPVELLPGNGETVVLLPPKERRVRSNKRRQMERKADTAQTQTPQATPKSVKWDVGIEVEGRKWSMLAAQGDHVGGTKTGEVENRRSGHANILAATWNALTHVKPDKTNRVVVKVSDPNVAKILNGTMQSKKNAEQVSLVQELAQRLNVTFTH